MTDSGYNRDTLLAILHSRIAEIRYYKADGKHRVLRGTLKEDLVPEAAKKGKAAPRKVLPNLVTMWDLDAAGWRSIRTDRIVEIL